MKASGIIVLLVLVSLASGATLHGRVYNGELRPAPAVVYLSGNGTSQSQVAPKGSYAFQSPPGNYTLTAVLTSNGSLTNFSTSEPVSLPSQGSYAFDLVVFGADLGEKELAQAAQALGEPAGKPAAPSTDYTLVIIGVLALALLVALAILARKNNAPAATAPASNTIDVTVRRQKQAPTGSPAPSKLSREHKSILKLLALSGGRSTQNALRKKLPWSEARTSILLSELEGVGKVRRRKLGRENTVEALD